VSEQIKQKNKCSYLSKLVMTVTVLKKKIFVFYAVLLLFTE